MLVLLGCTGCSLGPRSLLSTRLRYNEAVKSTSEQQLLLNIVRLRYTDTPSSLAITTIADQQELAAGLGILPFFTSAAAGDVGTYRGTVLPQAQVSSASRPTLSYTPLDDQEFTRRLFTPISLRGVAYLSKTTWPISTVFRLYLENLNWVSNAETASGPTPNAPPVYATFLQGIHALQRLQDRKLITIYAEEREEQVSSISTTTKVDAATMIETIKNDIEVRSEVNGTRWLRKKQQPVMRVDPSVGNDPDWMAFCTAFKLNPNLRTFDLTTDKLDPYLKDMPPTGLEVIDLETRSLLQVLFFVAHGVDVPLEHITCGIAPQTKGLHGEVFDWHQVLGGLFHVYCVQAKKPPPCAHVAVQYKGYWFYIDDRDRQTKATFALLLEVSRLELESPKSQGPIFTLPLAN